MANLLMGVQDLGKLNSAEFSFPKVCVVVPCHNVEDKVRGCIDSILGNGYPNIEVVIVDDFSIDGTVSEIEKAISDFGSEKVRLVGRNQGPRTRGGGWGRNEGLKHLSDAKYVHFCDSDDYVLPGLYMDAVCRMERTDADICIFQHRNQFSPTEIYDCNSRLAFKDGRGMKPTFNAREVRSIFLTSSIPAWNKLYRTDFVKKHGLRFQEIQRCNDQLFGLSALMLADRITFIPTHGYVYRVGTETSVTRAASEKGIGVECTLKAIEAVWDNLNSVPQHQALIPSFESYMAGELDYIAQNVDQSHLHAGYLEELRKFAEFSKAIRNRKVAEALEKLETKAREG